MYNTSVYFYFTLYRRIKLRTDISLKEIVITKSPLVNIYDFNINTGLNLAFL